MCSLQRVHPFFGSPALPPLSSFEGLYVPDNLQRLVSSSGDPPSFHGCRNASEDKVFLHSLWMCSHESCSSKIYLSSAITHYVFVPPRTRRPHEDEIPFASPPPNVSDRRHQSLEKPPTACACVTNKTADAKTAAPRCPLPPPPPAPLWWQMERRFRSLTAARRLHPTPKNEEPCTEVCKAKRHPNYVTQDGGKLFFPRCH